MIKKLTIASILSLAFFSPINAQACGLFQWRLFNRAPSCCYYEQQTPTTSCEVKREYAPTPRQELDESDLSDLNPTEKTLLDIVNDCRALHGLRSLRPDRRLFDGANSQTRRDAARGFLLHEGAPEILAQNYRGLEDAIKQWLASPAHRALLLNGSFTRCGASFYKDQYGRVWCAVRFN